MLAVASATRGAGAGSDDLYLQIVKHLDPADQIAQLAALAEGLALASALGLSSEDVQATASPSAPPARLGVHSTLATR